MESAKEFIDRKDREWAEHRKRPIRMKDIGRAGFHYWNREAWTFMVQSNQPQKVFVVERVRHTRHEGERAMPGGAQVGDIEYRFGYFLIGRIGRANGRWIWGQFSPMIPQSDLARLLDKARSEGTLLVD